MRLSGFAALLAFSGLTGAAMAQVVADGSTATTVTVGRDGAVTVGIAPAGRSGVSLNRYDQLNVPKPGVRLDNRQEAARTIVNEVTGTGTTHIGGPVEVLGQRAHVIVANPNGIVIDGARFVNTGRVALTTGSIGLEQRQIAPGIFQDNAVSTVSGGTIRIGAGGLSGQMDAVDLIAHQVRVQGAVRNDNPREGSSVQITAGKTRTEFDSATLPGNVDAGWRQSKANGTAAENAVLVEIDRPGVLGANRIGIEVNGKGAGVRYAGEGLAGARGFSLRADGQVVLDGGAINAPDGAVQIAGQKLGFTRSQITAQQIGIAGKGTVRVDQGKFAAKGTDKAPGVLSVEAGAFLDRGGHYRADGAVLLSSRGDLGFSGTNLRAGRLVTLKAVGMLTASDAELRAGGHLTGAAHRLSFSGIQKQTAIVAEGGALVLGAKGDLVNRGALLQGGTKADDLTAPDGTASAGAVTLNIGGDLVNASTEHLSVVFGAGGDVITSVGGDIDNLRGRFLANGGVGLKAGGDILNRVPLPDGRRNAAVIRESRDGKRIWWTLGLKRERVTRLRYDYGTLKRPEHIGLMTATQAVTLTAGGRILNEGGDISAGAGDITLTAAEVETASVAAGAVDVRRLCVLTCRYAGSGAVLSYGGRIEAGGALSVNASRKVLNDGGILRAKGDVTLNAPAVEVRAARIPQLVKRPGGLYNFWRSRAAWVFLRDQFGQIVSDTGRLTVRSDTPIRVMGGSLTAAKGSELSAGQKIVARPAAIGLDAEYIGLLRFLPLMGGTR